MLINKDQVNLIKENKICYIKNSFSLEKEYDFNLISSLLEGNNLRVEQKTNINNLKDVIQILNVNNCSKELKTFFDLLSKLFKYERDSRDGVDLYFSLVSQVGLAHEDIEDVFILGLKGKTIYRLYNEENKDFYIEKGDIIFIPRGIKHKAIGINPRIIASIGFYGKRFK